MFVSILAFVLAAFSAGADSEFPLSVQGNTASVELKLAYGPSLPPAVGDNVQQDKLGLSRANGGERFFLSFRAPKQITKIRVVAYSRSGKGSVVMRNAVGDSQLIKELFQFASLKEGIADNYNGLIRLKAGDAISTTPQSALREITLQAEAFAENDTTLYLEFTSPEGFTSDEYLAVRSETGSTFGNYVDESIENLTLRSARKIMSISRDPALEELKETNWTCTVVSPAGKDIDYKTRSFFVNADGILSSYTDLVANPLPWIRSEDAWIAKIVRPGERAGCSDRASYMSVRVTPAGNHVVEYLLNRTQYYQECMNDGYNRWELDRNLAENTLPSVVNNRKYAAAKQYELCRPVRF